MMKKSMLIVVGLTLVSSPVLAAKVTHHCVGKDTKEISITSAPGKSSAAACKAAGGTWVRMKTAKAK